MKIKELIYKTPEMTEEKLISIIDTHKYSLKKPLKDKFNNSEDILKEWDIIQEKKSNLTKSQRDQICALVSVSLIEMTKGINDGESRGTSSSSN